MFGVVARNPEFKKLWYAQIVSQFGDWLSHLAVLATIAELSGEGAALGVGMLFGLDLALRFLPTTLLGPLAGPVADRLPRLPVMVVADVVRACVVLALIWVDEPGELPLLYVLVALQMGVSLFFDAARAASVPNTVTPDDLHASYALSAATWSVMLCTGSLVGGALLEATNPDTVFAIDALTYVASALLLAKLRLPPLPVHADPFRWRELLLLTELRRGLRHVRSLGLVPAIFAKTFWGPAGGFLVMLPIAASASFGGDARTGAFALGVFFCARGVGTGFGPFLGRRLFGSDDRLLRIQVTLGFAVAVLGYALFPVSENLYAAAACVALAHMGGSGLWTASTVLWQKHVADAYRGRVFALESQCLTFAFAASGVLAGWIYDHGGGVDGTTWIICSAVAIGGATWTWLAKVDSRGPTH